MEIKNKMNQITCPGAFLRIDAKHILDIFIGLDEQGRYTLAILCDSEPPLVESLKYLKAERRLKKDGKFTFNIILVDMRFEEMFYDLCGNLVDASRDASTKDEALLAIIERFKAWVEFLKKGKAQLMTENEVKGLLGELIFINDFLLNKNDFDHVFTAWTGPQKTDRDFEFENIWYEIKATTSGSQSVQITSVEQLDVDENGVLSVLFLDKTSPLDKNGINLNSLVKSIVEKLTLSQRNELERYLLVNFGFSYQEEYLKMNWKLNSYQFYRVDKTFPCIRKPDLNEAVSKVSYSLSLACLTAWRENNI